MVRLFRGGRGGRGVPRPPFSFPRHMRPPRDFEPEFIHPYGAPRGRLLRGNIRPGPPHPRLPPPLSPRMGPSPLPPPPPRPLHRPPHQPPLNHRELHMSGPIPRRPHPMNRPGIPPPMHSRPLGPPPLTRPLRPGPPFLRGRGGPARRGVGVKRLGTTTNGRNKKPPKRKEKKEESEVSKPWVTELLKTEIHKKYQLFEAAKEKKTDADWQAFKDQRILVGKMTNIAKLEYIGSHPEADVDQIMYGLTPGNKG